MSRRASTALTTPLVLTSLLLTTACSGTGARPAPSTQVERGLFFVERDTHGHEFPVSGAPGDAQPERPVARIADGATIDVNSKLMIMLRRSELAGPSDLVVEDLSVAADRLVSSLTAIGDLYDVVREAEAAWAALEALPTARQTGSAEEQAFVQLRRRRGQLEEELLASLRMLWPLGDPMAAADRQRVEAHYGELDEPAKRSEAVAKLLQLLDTRIERWNVEVDELERRARATLSSRKLRIESFLMPQEDAEHPVAVHVEGYDSLENMQVTQIDRLGVRLTEPERRQLRTLQDATRSVATALEQIRRRQDGWLALFQAVAPLLQRIDGVLALVESLQQDPLHSRAERLAEHFEQFATALRAAGATFDRQALQDALGAAIEGSQQWPGLAALAGDLQTMRGRWQNAAGEDLLDLGRDSVELATRVQATATELADQVDPEAIAGFASSLAEQFRAQLTQRANDASLQQAWRALHADFTAWTELLQACQSSLHDLSRLLGEKQLPPMVPMRNASSLDVSLDTAGDTHIDLRTTPRKAGDHLFVRARLLDADAQDVATPLTVTLGIAKLGWHADLVPSIVYTRADRLAGGSNRGGFAPALSWQWSYGPRPDEGDRYLSRSLGWGAGLHATFLNFDPDRDPQFGIGATLGLWDDKLMAGVGYNLFADDAGDGRIYYFFGSSLLPLLQALNGD